MHAISPLYVNASSPMYGLPPRGGSPVQNLSQELVRRLAEVDAEAKSMELARKLAHLQTEARLVAQTKQDVQNEFERSRQTIERAYGSVLLRPESPRADLDSEVEEAMWWSREQQRRETDLAAWEEEERQRRAQMLNAWEEADRQRWQHEEEERRATLARMWDAEEAELRRAAEARWEAQQIKERAAAEQQQILLLQQKALREQAAAADATRRANERAAWEAQEYARREAEREKWDQQQLQTREAADAERRAKAEAEAREIERQSWLVIEQARRAAERERWEAHEHAKRAAAISVDAAAQVAAVSTAAALNPTIGGAMRRSNSQGTMAQRRQARSQAQAHTPALSSNLERPCSNVGMDVLLEPPLQPAPQPPSSFASGSRQALFDVAKASPAKADPAEAEAAAAVEAEAQHRAAAAAFSSSRRRETPNTRRTSLEEASAGGSSAWASEAEDVAHARREAALARAAAEKAEAEAALAQAELAKAEAEKKRALATAQAERYRLETEAARAETQALRDASIRDAAAFEAAEAARREAMKAAAHACDAAARGAVHASSVPSTPIHRTVYVEPAAPAPALEEAPLWGAPQRLLSALGICTSPDAAASRTGGKAAAELRLFTALGICPSPHAHTMGAGATAEADGPTPLSASRDARQLEEYRKLRHGEQLADARTSTAGWAPPIDAEACAATASTLPFEGSLRASEAASTTWPPTPEPASPTLQPGWQIAVKDEDGGANVDTQTVDESGDDDEERRARSELVQEL